MNGMDDYPEETEIIDFFGNGKKGAFSKTNDGVIIFPDKNSGIQIDVGDTWICRLRKHQNLEKRIYWAWPIEKINDQTKTLTWNSTVIQYCSETLTYADGFEITALGNDTISSSEFVNDRYLAYRSLDGTYMELIIDPQGDIICKDNTMSIEDVDMFISNEFPVNLDYIKRDGSFLIKLNNNGILNQQ